MPACKVKQEMGITIVMATHDIEAITVHANKIAYTGNKSVTVQDSGTAINEGLINDLYGYHVNFHVKKHECDSCRYRYPGKEAN